MGDSIDVIFPGLTEREKNAFDIFDRINAINRCNGELIWDDVAEYLEIRNKNRLYDSLKVEMVKLKLFNNGIRIYVDHKINGELALWIKDFSKPYNLISRDAICITSPTMLIEILNNEIGFLNPIGTTGSAGPMGATGPVGGQV